MANLYKKSIGRKSLETRVSRMSQVAGVRLATLEEGIEQGVKVADVCTGSGLSFTVALSRGMDIYSADYCGRALGWLSPVGLAAPSFFEPEGLGWLRTFGGGLLTTCGLTYLGAPGTDEGQQLGLHGRFSNLPAGNVRVSRDWAGEDYEMSIEGEVTEAMPVVGEFVRLRRKITARMGESRFFVSDVVENFGCKSIPHMILYHFNLGYPLLDEGARLLLPSLHAKPRDEAAAVEAEKWAEVLPPAAGFQERVYYHQTGADAEGRTLAALSNPNLDGGLALYVGFLKKQLPRLVQWKMCAAGNYVMGIEPANCWVGGRGRARAKGDLQFLEPGEKRSYDLEVGVLCGSEIALIEERIRAMR
jgi:hypothetical protein